MRFLTYTLGDESIPTPPPTPELMEEMGKFIAEYEAAGKLVTAGGMGPSALGAKVTLDENGEFSVVDGPFAEAKELIGGWALLELEDLDEAKECARRFLSIAGPGTSHIRQVF